MSSFHMTSFFSQPQCGERQTNAIIFKILYPLYLLQFASIFTEALPLYRQSFQ